MSLAATVPGCVWIATEVGWRCRGVAALLIGPHEREAVLIHVIAHCNLRILLQNGHHALVSFALLLLLTSDALLTALRLPLFDFLNLASAERAMVSTLYTGTKGEKSIVGYLCSFISFHSEKAPLIPSAAIPTAAAS